MSTKPNTSQITYDTGSNKQDLNNILDTVVPITDYTALRNYTGRATQVRITADGISGFFKYDATDSTSTDNGGTIIVSGTKRWKRLFDGSVNVKWFCAKGDGVSDDTAAIQAAVDFASSINAGIDLCGLRYVTSSVKVKNGLRYLKEGTLVPTGRSAKAVVLFEGGTIGGVPVTRFALQNIDVDCSNNPEHVVYAEGCTYCIFENNNFYSLQGDNLSVNHGIMLCEGSKYNRIAFNSIQAKQYSLNGVMIGLFSAGVDAYYGYFENATGNITAPANPCEHNIIIGNRLYGGQQGVWVSGGNKNNVCDNNIEGSRDRGVILIASTKNTVDGNNLYDTKSSGIHMAYGCTCNTITGNTVVQPNSIGGEAGIQAYVGCGGNIIVGNNVQTESNYGIYVAVSSSRNLIHNNRITRYRIAGIAIQSDWWGSGGQGIYGRLNYGPPATGNRWAFTDTNGNSVRDNYIEEPNNAGNISGNDCGIALIQVKSPDTVSQYKIKGTDVCGNKIETNALTHNLYVFEDVAGGVSGGNLIGNTFLDKTLSKFGGNNPAYSPDGFSAAFEQISQNSGLNTRQSWTPVIAGTSTTGSATYTTQKATYTRLNKYTVEVVIQLVWTGHTGTGGISIPLPTPAQAPAKGGLLRIGSLFSEGLTLNATKWPTAALGTNNENIVLYECQSSGAVGMVPISAAGTVYLTGTYEYRNLT